MLRFEGPRGMTFVMGYDVFILKRLRSGVALGSLLTAQDSPKKTCPAVNGKRCIEISLNVFYVFFCFICFFQTFVTYLFVVFVQQCDFHEIAVILTKTSKIHSPGRSWGALGHLLEASWGLLGASWRPLGASWAPLGASWGPLGAS